MKSTIISILQQRMDKCTSEQFWLTGFISGLNSYLILNKDEIIKSINSIYIIIAVIVILCCSICYLIHRHSSYYKIRLEMSQLLENENDAPSFLKLQISPWEMRSLAGTSLYILLVLIFTVTTVVAYT